GWRVPARGAGERGGAPSADQRGGGGRRRLRGAARALVPSFGGDRVRPPAGAPPVRVVRGHVGGVRARDRGRADVRLPEGGRGTARAGAGTGRDAGQRDRAGRRGAGRGRAPLPGRIRAPQDRGCRGRQIGRAHV